MIRIGINKHPTLFLSNTNQSKLVLRSHSRFSASLGCRLIFCTAEKCPNLFKTSQKTRLDDHLKPANQLRLV